MFSNSMVTNTLHTELIWAWPGFLQNVIYKTTATGDVYGTDDKSTGVVFWLMKFDCDHSLQDQPLEARYE